MEQEHFQQQLLARLDIVIRLLLSRPESGNAPSIANMARGLAEMGLSPSEIGAILGKSSNYVSATLGTRNTKSSKGKNK